MSIFVRRAGRACLAVTLLALGAAAVPVSPAAMAQSAVHASVSIQAQTVTAAAAAAGAGWIRRDLSSNGAVVDAISHKPNAGDTADAIMALVASGDGSVQVKRATQWLEHNYSSYVSAKGVDSPGPLGLVVLAAVAAGADPTRFGGEASANDLVARLVATEHLDGAFLQGCSVRQALRTRSASPSHFSR